MKRLVLLIFGAVAIGLAIFFFTNKTSTKTETSVTRARTVVPISDTSLANDTPSTMIYEDDSVLVSLIPLQSDETVLNTLSVDFDGDGYDDQINAVKKSTTPYIVLLVGLYNPFRSQYDRTEELITEIMQPQTFTYTCMDITGTHQNALIYSGVAEDTSSIMKIYLPQKNGTEFNLKIIGDFCSDGTIFIQQMDRYDSYETQRATGTSFPVWVYSSDNSRGNDTLDQLQTMYSWNPQQKQYVKTSENRITETRIATKEIQRIQDGTVETFVNHLDGLWYKIGSTANDIRYLFFNSEDNEIIFQTDDSQEVYNWVTNTLRRNGMYISAVNSSIANLTRRIDISLSSADEIKIRNQDDVQMTISESNLWDGQYKKQTSKTVLQTQPKTSPSIIDILEKQEEWQTEKGIKLTFAKGSYTMNNQKGRTTSISCGSYSILQIDGLAGEPFYNHDTYTFDIEKDSSGEPTLITLIPVTVTPVTVVATSFSPIQLKPVLKTE